MSEVVTVRIAGADHQVSRAQVLEATRYQRPPRALGTGGQWVLIRDRRVSARWALRRTLEATDRADVAASVQTWHALDALRRLGFTTTT
ncbi:hypothetical protein [Cellulomonas sp. P5_C5]